MSVNAKLIKQKMKSVANIGKITGAMEMISVSKMKRAIARQSESQDYATSALDILSTLHRYSEVNDPYVSGRPNAPKTLMLIIAANKGLCGGYNINVSKKVSQYIADHPDADIDVIAVGKQAAKIAWRNKLNVLANFTEYGDEFSDDDLNAILGTLLTTFNEDQDYANVVVAYTHFISSLAFEPKVQEIIPFSLESSKEVLHFDENNRKEVPYVFEPSETKVFKHVIPIVLNAVVYQMLTESLASEYSSRVTAMKNASDNANELLDDLRTNYNRARQASITQEIAEIVGGSSAVSSN